MIEIRELRKTFGPTRALGDVSLDIAEGERVMLVGPNGAGKTTLLRILATLSRPTGGRVRIDGADPFTEGPRVRRGIGFLSHETLLYGDLTARQNLQFYARMYGLPTPDVRIRELLIEVGLDHRQDDLVQTYSRGMQQRLAVVRAILHSPRLLLLDEPYSGLDPLAAESLTHLLHRLVEAGCTLLLTTHHALAEGQLADRMVILNGGQVVHDGPVGDSDTFAARYRALVQPGPADRGGRPDQSGRGGEDA